MDMEKFTQKSRQALLDAGQLAAEKHHQEVSGKHLMSALLEQEGGVTIRFLEQAGINIAVFRDGLNRLLDKIPSVYGYEGSVYMSGTVSRIVARAEKEAQGLKDEYVSENI